MATPPLTASGLLLKAQHDTIDDAIALFRLLYEDEASAKNQPAIESMILRLENMKRSL